MQLGWISPAFAAFLFAYPGRADAVTTWNWSFTGFNGGGTVAASGTFTSADVSPQILTTSAITGIAGNVTYTGSNPGTRAITTLQLSTFQWDGSTGFLVGTGGFNFDTATEPNNSLYQNISGYYVPTDFDRAIGSLNSGYTITSASLAPASPSPSSSVPGPLPLFGAAAAFGVSRRLRSRIRSSVTSSV